MGIIAFCKMVKNNKPFLLFIIACSCFINIISQVNYTKSNSFITENGKKYYVHKVEKQQSLYAISKLYETDINEITKENPSIKDGLKTGQAIKIPFNTKLKSTVITSSDKSVSNSTSSKPSSTFKEEKKAVTNEKQFIQTKPLSLKVIDTSKYFVHIVEPGETLYKIRKMYDLKEKDILEANPEAAYGLRSGEEIYILKTKSNEKIIKEKEVKNLAIIDSFKNNLNKIDSVTKDSANTIITKDKKEVYKIAMILPFGLNAIPSAMQLAKEDKNYPIVQNIAIDFYEGSKKALDSLAKIGIKPEIYYYDIDENDSAKLESLLASESFKESDLIIGPMYASAFKRVADFARQNKIFIVSPLAQQNKVLYDNPYAIKINPSNNTLVEALADYLYYEKKDHDVILVSTGNSKDLNMIKSFRQRYFENKRLKDPNFSDSIPVVKNADGIKANYKSKPTALVLFTNNQNFLTGYLMGLSGAFGNNNNITLYGLQSWTGFENLDPEYLNRLNYTYPVAFYADENNQVIKSHYNHYFDKHNTAPSEYYYQGFDVVYFLLKELKQKGPEIFTHLEDTKTTGMVTKFNFFRPNKRTGYENKSISIVQYLDYQFKKIY
jgi:ABC-type branched-subunit amino acid transport system substrate-binding protein/LysM repeat protein